MMTKMQLNNDIMLLNQYLSMCSEATKKNLYKDNKRQPDN